MRGNLLGKCGSMMQAARVYCFCLLLASLPSILAAPSVSHFDQANHLYEQGKYEDSIALYQSMIKGGYNSPGVYFNLGNACFKQGALGLALANYTKAARLAPRDPDIQANLRFTRDRVSGSVSIQPSPLQRLFGFFKVNEISILAAILFWTWALLFCVSRLRPNLAVSLRVPSLVFCSLFSVTLLLLVLSLFLQKQNIAIVTSRQATVHLGPFIESQDAYSVTDGTELRLLARRDDWLQVSDRSDRSGWLPATNAIVLEPFGAR